MKRNVNTCDATHFTRYTVFENGKEIGVGVECYAVY